MYFDTAVQEPTAQPAEQSKPALSYRIWPLINPANRRVSSLLGAAAVAKFTAFSRNSGSERLAVVRNSAVFEILASCWMA